MSEERFRTLAETLAIAILRGDYSAVWPLADKLLEERENNTFAQSLQLRNHRTIWQGYNLYRTEEFRNLCELLGVMWGLHTIEMAITVPAEGMVIVDQKYAGTQPVE